MTFMPKRPLPALMCLYLSLYQDYAASRKQPPTIPPKQPILASCPYFVQVSHSMATGISGTSMVGLSHLTLDP